MPMVPRDWTLLTVAAAQGRSLEPVQLQKVLFVLSREQELPPGSSYEFRNYNYGPFCQAIYQDAADLAKEGLVSIDSSSPWSRYSVTTAGAAEAESRRREAPADAAEYLERLVNWAMALSFRDLVRAIYERYPETKSHSIFRG